MAEKRDWKSLRLADVCPGKSAAQREAEAEECLGKSPSGPPRPANDDSLGIIFAGVTLLGVVAAGAFYALVAATPHRTLGATVSTSLEWERRRTEVRRAVLSADLPAKAESPRTDGEEGGRRPHE